jgi:hypothetical protein
MGWTMDAEAIGRTGAIYVGDLLRHAPGLAMQYTRRGERSFTMRGGWDGNRCTPSFYLDGMRWLPMGAPAIVEIERFVSTHELYGIEVYRSLGTIPVQFDDGRGCGAVVFWTKR